MSSKRLNDWTEWVKVSKLVRNQMKLSISSIYFWNSWWLFKINRYLKICSCVHMTYCNEYACKIMFSSVLFVLNVNCCSDEILSRYIYFSSLTFYCWFLMNTYRIIKLALVLNATRFSILLKAGADVNSQDYDGWTPLHAAAHWGQEETCKLLVEHMCDMQLKNNAVRKYTLSGTCVHSFSHTHFLQNLHWFGNHFIWKMIVKIFFLKLYIYM